MTAEIWMKYYSDLISMSATKHLSSLSHLPKLRAVRQTERDSLDMSWKSLKLPTRSVQAHTSQRWQQSTTSIIAFWHASRKLHWSFTQQSRNLRAQRTSKRCIRSHSSESKNIFSSLCSSAGRHKSLSSSLRFRTVPLESTTNNASWRQMNPWKGHSECYVLPRSDALRSSTGKCWGYNHFMARRKVSAHSQARIVYLRSVPNFGSIFHIIFTTWTKLICS